MNPTYASCSIASIALALALACGEAQSGAGASTSGGTTATSTGGAPEASACADGSAPRAFFRDDDGDGYGQRLAAGETCSGAPPEGHAFLGGTSDDCDDTDPDLYTWSNFYTDADGDGYGVANQEHTYDCRERAISGTAPNARDCDDADPALHLEQFVDTDGDGFGVEARTACVADDADGYATGPGDCDDAEASVHPYSEFEAPLDGIDSDCDGHDYPITACEGFVDPGSAVPVDENCEGAVDLFLASVSACLDCEGSRVELVVGNRGSVAAEVEVLISGTPGTTQAVPRRLGLEAPLAPGAISERLASSAPLPEIYLEVTSTNGIAECNPADNLGYVRVGFVECF